MFNSGFDTVVHGLNMIRSSFYTTTSINPREKAIVILGQQLSRLKADYNASIAARNAADVMMGAYGALHLKARSDLESAIDNTPEFWSAAAFADEAFNCKLAASQVVRNAERQCEIATNRYFLFMKLYDDYTDSADYEEGTTDE